MDERTDHVIGLDLGMAQDHSACAVVARTIRDGPRGRQGHYLLGHLHRWGLNTPYPDIVDAVAALAQTPPLDLPTLAVDSTGVGAACVQIFDVSKLRARLTPILITGGHAVTRGEKGG
jgi:hypothetical protein